VWGAACVLVEMYTGRTLFKSGDDIEQLAMFEGALGPVPASLIHNTSETKRAKMFTPYGLVKSQSYLTDPIAAKNINDQQALLHYFHPDDVLFYDLITRMLCYEPLERLSTKEALHHPFFSTQCECTCDRDNLYRHERKSTR